MKSIILIFFLFFKLFYSNNLNANESNVYEKLNEKQKGLYYGSENCELGSDDCLYFFSRLLEEIDLNDNLKETWIFGYSTYWYADTLFRQNKKQEAFKIWEKIISDEKYFNKPEYKEYKINSLNSLGWAYFTEVDFLNDKKSFDYMKLAAESNNPWALNNMGVFYEMGRNTKKDMKKAYKNYKKAADLGNHWAHANLADFYILGEGGAKKNYLKALFELKFSSLAQFTVNDNFKLKTLIKYGKLPQNNKEFLIWMINTLIETKDVNGFQEIAFSSNEIEEQFKWHFLATKKAATLELKNRSLQELNIIEKKYLNTEKIVQLKKDSEKWLEKNWN